MSSVAEVNADLPTLMLVFKKNVFVCLYFMDRIFPQVNSGS